MFAGVGIIGALASILASILVPDAPAPEEVPAAAAGSPAPAQPSTPAAPATPVSASVETELASLRAEIEALRRSLAVDPGGSPG
jgi:hypothetical protein